jgi:hypothetical protein
LDKAIGFESQGNGIALIFNEKTQPFNNRDDLPSGLYELGAIDGHLKMSHQGIHNLVQRVGEKAISQSS